MEKILLPHGKMKLLAKEMGLAAGTCSKYLKGYYDETDPFTVQKANAIREKALSMGGLKA